MKKPNPDPKHVVTVILTPVQGGQVTEQVEVPPEGDTIENILQKMGRSPGRMNFSVIRSAAGTDKVQPGDTLQANEPQPVSSSAVVRPGSQVQGMERPAGS